MKQEEKESRKKMKTSKETGTLDVSVIIPAYNSEKTLETAIQSALSQKEVEVEVIVVDDASKDATEQLVRKFQDDSRVVYLKNATNQGVAASRNLGVRTAKADYVAFLDSDDFWKEDKLIKQLSMMKKKKAVLCSAGRELMTPKGEKTGKIMETKEDITYKMMLHQNHINCSAVLLLRKVALEFPMEKDEVHEDYLTWLKILKKYKRACAVNEPLLVYRLSTTGKSGNKLHSAKLTYGVYRHMGFGIAKSLICFCCYAFCGVWKYLKA